MVHNLPEFRKKDFATVRAICPDSFMTSPSFPVSCRPPTLSFDWLTGTDSIYRVDPPIEVQARPITTPGGVKLYNLSEGNTGFPTYLLRLSESI